MTVKELIDRLAQYPPDLEVLVSRDAEGNGFSPLEDFGTYLGRKENSTRHGDEYSIIDEGDWDIEHDDEGPYPGDNCLVLWP